MAINRPISDGGDDGLTGWTIQGGGSTFFDTLDDYNDSKFMRSAASGNQREYVGLSGSIDSSVDARTRYMNIRLRAAGGVLAAGSILAINIFADDGKTAAATNIDLTDVAKAPASFTDFSLLFPVNWSASGAATLTYRITLVPGGGNTKAVDISHLSFGDAEAASIDYPVAGGASVTMTGSAAASADKAQAGASSVTMSGASGVPPTRGKPVNQQMNSYFFMPPGSVVGIGDEAIIGQGMGVKPLRKRKRDE